jgi:hypothetical protein
MKAVPPGRTGVPDGAPVAATFSISQRAAQGEIPPGWTLMHRCFAISAALTAGCLSRRCAAGGCWRRDRDRTGCDPHRAIGDAMMLLQWRMPDPVLVLRWRGPDGGLANVATANPPSPVPTLIGPPGVAGPRVLKGRSPRSLTAGHSIEILQHIKG